MRKIIALFKIRALEVERDRQSRVLAATTGALGRAVLFARQEITSRDLARARADYTALHAPGVRFTWKEA